MSRKIVTGKRAKADEHDTLVDSNAESVPKLAAPTALSLPRPSPFEYCEVDAIEADLMCPVCLAPLFEPVTHVPCGRMFCACCLSSCAACPLCRRPLDGVDSTQVVKTRYILQKLDEIPVRCPGTISLLLLVLSVAHPSSSLQSVGRAFNAPFSDLTFRVAPCRVLVPVEYPLLQKI